MILGLAVAKFGPDSGYSVSAGAVLIAVESLAWFMAPRDTRRPAARSNAAGL